MSHMKKIILLSIIFSSTLMINKSLLAPYFHNIKNDLDVPVVIKTTNEIGQPDYFYLPERTYGRIWFGAACIKAFTVMISNSDKKRLEDSLKNTAMPVTRKYRLIDKNGKIHVKEGNNIYKINLKKGHDYNLFINADGSLTSQWKNLGGSGSVAWIQSIINSHNASITLDYKDESRESYSIATRDPIIPLDRPIPWISNNGSTAYFLDITIKTDPKPFNTELAKLKPTQAKELAAVYHIPLGANRCTWKNILINYGTKERGSYLNVREVDDNTVASWGTSPEVNLNDTARPQTIPGYSYLVKSNN